MAGPKVEIRLPYRRTHPLKAIGRRLLYALAALAAMFLVVLADRGGYRDSADGPVSALDALYYATVSLSTTGYGDIVPVSDRARLVNAVLVTPLRIAFLAVLVGTTFEVLTQRTREELRLTRWRSKLRGHTIVIGYGTKGRAAIDTLVATGAQREDFVVVDRRPEVIAEANRDGVAGVVGDATRSAVLREAGLAEAARLIIAPDRDDAAVLTTLTARQLNATIPIIAAVREAENEPLLLRSGATAAITSSEAAGRLLGYAARSPAISELFADLLVHGEGLEVVERDVQPGEVGSAPAGRVLAVVRDGTYLPFADVDAVRPGDRLVAVVAKP